jgi:hypothetical protein
MSYKVIKLIQACHKTYSNSLQNQLHTRNESFTPTDGLIFVTNHSQASRNFLFFLGISGILKK